MWCRSERVLRRVWRGCRTLLHRTLHPRPSHSAPLWIRHTYAFSQGEVAPASPLAVALRSSPNAFCESSSGSRNLRCCTVFQGPRCSYEQALKAQKDILLVLFHVRNWDNGMPRMGWMTLRSHSRGVCGSPPMRDTEAERVPSSSREAQSRTAVESVSRASGPEAVPHATDSELSRLLPQEGEPRLPLERGTMAIPALHTPVACWSVEASAHMDICALYDIRCLPTWLGYRDGVLMGRVEGGDGDELLQLVQSLQAPLPPAPEEDVD